MFIRQANEDEMLALWRETADNMRPTSAFFYENIRSKNAELWAYDDDGRLAGELFVFKSLEDNDFANGKDKAYLCAFRISKELQGQGYGTKLISHVIDHLKVSGIKTVTIGVGETEDANIRLYHRLGFCEKIKDCNADPCDVDGNMQPKSCETFWLLKREL
ncbi:MAG: GNAT family N-acetyltransferase [Dehalococcoidales bacterium]|nr:MAG: GNAT family N-acetyltransferase [Dehalococcoidales bacterium]